VIATGEMPYPDSVDERADGEEFNKRVETFALAGRSILHLTNCPEGMVIDSTTLAALSTSGKVKIRKLSRHEEGDCDCRATTVIIEGNNISPGGDLLSRSIVCVLNPEMANPGDRVFDEDNKPHKVVLKDREKYLTAVFTIIIAYHVAGYPEVEFKHMAAFERFEQLIQKPLIWLGQKDMRKSMSEMRAVDLKEEKLVRLLRIWSELFKYKESRERITIADCTKKGHASCGAFAQIITIGRGGWI
jgi:putative DNA primase/helicase